MKTLKPKYEMKQIEINKDSINNFIVNLNDRRKIRDGEVKKILNGIENGIHFNSPFVVNEKNGKFHLVDGNHRFEAIKIVIKKNVDFKINVWVALYKNLIEDEEKEVYKIWNIGTSQTATDFLKQYFRTLPLGEEMLKRLPVTIYGDDTHLPIKPVVGIQVQTKKSNKFNGGYSVSKEQTLIDFSEITNEDIETLESFFCFMEKVFGKYYKHSQFYQTTPFSAFYRIWFDNRDLDEELLVNLFKKVFATYPEKWKDWTSHGGRSASITMYSVALSALNQISKRYPLLSDKDLIEIEDKNKVEKYKIEKIVKLVKK